jgi:hypothetical protein
MKNRNVGLEPAAMIPSIRRRNQRIRLVCVAATISFDALRSTPDRSNPIARFL